MALDIGTKLVVTRKARFYTTLSLDSNEILRVYPGDILTLVGSVIGPYDKPAVTLQNKDGDCCVTFAIEGIEGGRHSYARLLSPLEQLALEAEARV